MGRIERLAGAAVGAGAVLVLLYLLLPIVVVVGSSFTATGFLTFPPRGLSLSWYQSILDSPDWLDSIRLSLLLALATTALATAIGIPAAVALARRSFPGSRWLSMAFLSPLILPQIVLGVGLLQYLSAIGLARHFAAILAGHVVITLPYVIRSVMATLAGFDSSVEEAAADLGASPLVTFGTVTLPLIKAGVIAGGLFAFVISWTNVEVSMFLTTSALNPMPVKIMNYVAYNVDPLVAAISAVSVYIGLLLLLLIDSTLGLEKFAQTGPR